MRHRETFGMKLPPAGFIAGMAALSLVFGWVARGAILMPPDRATVTVIDSWRLACPQRSALNVACELVQDVVDARTRATVVRFVITRRGGRPVLDIVAPFNVLIAPKLGMQLGDTPMAAYAYRTCAGVGCIATIKPDDALYNSIVHAKKIGIFYAGVNGQVQGYQLVLKSYDDAVRMLDDSEAKRHSWLRRVLL